MAQRMESVAPPGGVMLSASTARLVGAAADLAEPELVHIKGSAQAVPAHRLLAVAAEAAGFADRMCRWWDATWEVAPLRASWIARSSGQGCVVCVAGPAGIGKTRLVDEAVRLANSRDIAGVRHLLRIARQLTSRFKCGCPSAARGHRGKRSAMTRRRARKCVRRSRMPATRICCCCMTCSGIRDTHARCRTSSLTRGDGG